MGNKKMVVTCNKCNSTDVVTEEKYFNRKYRRVVDAGAINWMVLDSGTLDRSYPSLSSVDRKLVCHCNNCGNNFEEKLSSEIFDLLPGQIEY